MTNPRHIVAGHFLSLDGVAGSRKEWDDIAFLDGNVRAALAALRKRPGEDIDLSGSVALTRAFLRAGLIDDLRLLVRPLDSPTGPPMSLVDAAIPATGVVQLRYTPAR